MFFDVNKLNIYDRKDTKNQVENKYFLEKTIFYFVICSLIRIFALASLMMQDILLDSFTITTVSKKSKNFLYWDCTLTGRSFPI